MTKVLVGGCFDILHPGHVIFLKKAKEQGNKLIVLLESDEKIKKIKGVNRPIHNQKMRALILKALKFVDQVVLLPFIEKEDEYDAVIKKIKPDIIATTKGDPDSHHKKRAAKLVGAKLKYIARLTGYCSSRILKV